MMVERGPTAVQDELTRAKVRLAELDDERERVSQHISELRARLSAIEMSRDHPPQQIPLPTAPVPSNSAQKVALFMDLFRRRADVYPKRWTNEKKGTKGYSPACSNEWVHGVCDKRSVKCGECPNQAFRFIGEGFDDARLDTLFLAMPVSWKGTLVQYAGRLHRKHHAKTEVRVMDYVDRQVPMLARMFDKRMRGYRALGYSMGEHDPGDLVEDDYVIEYDEAVLRSLEDDSP